jgi:hypothetical protein
LTTINTQHIIDERKALGGYKMILTLEILDELRCIKCDCRVSKSAIDDAANFEDGYKTNK